MLHSDNGASMKATETLALYQEKGVEFSHSLTRVSNDNPYSKSLFRTMKCSGDFLDPRKGFESIAACNTWVQDFVWYYNEVHRHRSIKMVTPGSRLRGEDIEILKHRKETIERARGQHPNRWKQAKTMDCSHNKEVMLNPDKTSQIQQVQC